MDSKGFTIAELIVSIFIMGVIMFVVIAMVLNVLQAPKAGLEALSQIDQARTVAAKFTSDLRGAINCAGGSSPILSAGDSQIIFCSDSKRGSTDSKLDIDKIRYFKSGATLYKGVISPTFTGSGYVYTSSEIISTVMSGLDTNSVFPLFYYYDKDYTGAGGALTQPVNMANVQFVTINIPIIKEKLDPSSTDTSMTQWSYRKAITISNTNVGSDLSNFPALVSFSSDSDIGSQCLATGNDIRFTDSLGNMLAYEKVSWSGGAGSPASGIFWVRIPTILSASPTLIYIYYGNTNASNDWTATGSPITIAQSVWSSGYNAVWHLDEVGISPTVYDSTLNNTDSVSQIWTPTNGQVYGAGSFNGSTANISFGNPSALQITGDQTIDMWLKPASQSSRQNPYAKAYGGEGTITAETNGSLNYFYGTFGGDSSPYQGFSSSPATISIGDWSHLAVVRDLINMKLYWYKNGVANSPANANYSAAATSSGIAYLGKGYVSNFNGLIDEVRISSVARSADWIKFEYRNMYDADHNMTFANQEDSSGGLQIESSNSFTLTAGATIRSLRSQNALGQ